MPKKFKTNHKTSPICILCKQNEKPICDGHKKDKSNKMRNWIRRKLKQLKYKRPFKENLSLCLTHYNLYKKEVTSSFLEDTFFLIFSSLE